MAAMKLDVPLIRQPKDSVDCGVAAVTMVLNFHRTEKTFEEVKKDISTDEVGTYAPQLGEYLARQHFSVDIVVRNPLLFTRNDENLDKNSLTEKFNRLQHKGVSIHNLKVINYFNNFLKWPQNKVTVKIPDKNDIEEEINSGRPLIAFLTNAALYRENIAEKHKKDFSYTFHTVVITGLENGKVFVNDPYAEEDGGSKEYPLEDFLFSMYSSSLGDLDNGSLIKVRK